MRTLLITAVLLAVASGVYVFLTLREGIRAGHGSWRMLIEPRASRVPRRLRLLSAAFWAILVPGLGALAVLWLQS